MRSTSRRTDRRSKAIWLPSQDAINAARKQLPYFEPYDTRKLLADAARTNNGIVTDAAITAVYNQHCRAQMVQLLSALGCDPRDQLFLSKALFKLAKLHHNIGRLVNQNEPYRFGLNRIEFEFLFDLCAAPFGFNQPVAKWRGCPVPEALTGIFLH
jgi:hypothetical protein